jgi:alanine racemase
MSTDHRTRRAWVEIDAGALRRNFGRIRSAAGPGVPVIPMVKADAYGLGAEDAVRTLEPEAPFAYGVATVPEGVALRRSGVTRPVLVCSPLVSDDLPDAVREGLTVSLSDLLGLEALRAVARSLGCAATFQAEVDTGMGRAGFLPDEIETWGPVVAGAHGQDGLSWVGCFTHLHSADLAGGPGVDEQVEAFERVTARLRPPEGCLLHVANSAAAFRLGARAGAVRPGIFLYGGGVGPDLPVPEAVARVRARVVRVREAPPGTPAGYGATYRAAAHERWATLAIGYADGLPRALGGRGSAVVGGRRAPLVGRLSMDMSVANISGLEGVEPGDVATLMGGPGEGAVTLDEVAGLAGTISYEILTGLGPRLPRIWMEQGGV